MTGDPAVESGSDNDTEALLDTMETPDVDADEAAHSDTVERPDADDATVSRRDADIDGGDADSLDAAEDASLDAPTDAPGEGVDDTGSLAPRDHTEVVWSRLGVAETVAIPASLFSPDLYPMEQGGVRGSIQGADLAETQAVFTHYPFRIELQSSGRLRAWDTRSSRNYGVESSYVAAVGETLDFDFSSHYSTDGRNLPIWRLSVSGDRETQRDEVTWNRDDRLQTMPRLGNPGGTNKNVACSGCTLDIELYRYATSYRDGVILDFDPEVAALESWPHNDIGPSATPSTQFVRTDVAGSPACIQFETQVDDSTTSTGGKRNEVAEAFERPYESTFFYGMRFRIDPLWVDSGTDDNFYILSQFWTGGPPDAAIIYRNGRLRLGVFAEAATGSTDANRARYEEAVERGVWLNVVYQYRKSETDGLLRAWLLREDIDDAYRLVIDYAGQLSDPEDEESGIWIKAGTYRRANDHGPTVVQIDRNKVGVTFEAADPRRL